MKQFALALVVLFTTVASTFGQGYRIEFNIDGLHGGDCILAHYYADQNRIVDTSFVSPNGKVVFKGEESLLNGIYILVLPNRSYIELVVPNNDQDFKINLDTSLSVMAKEIHGSEENRIFLEFDQFAHQKSMALRALKKEEEHIDSDIDKQRIAREKKTIDADVKNKRKEIVNTYPASLVATFFRAGMEVPIPDELKDDTTGKKFEYYREHYWDNINLKEDGLIRTPLYHRKMEYYFTKLHLQIADSIIPAIDNLANRLEANQSMELFKYTVWWTTKHYEDSKLMCMDKMLHHMAKNYYCAGRTFWADSSLTAKMCEHASKIGPTLCNSIAPDLTLVDTTLTREVTLSKIEYPVTILIFWDIECGHCKKEIPKIKELYDTMNQKGVQVFAVYTQGDWKGWRKYCRENKLEWINVMDAYNKATYRKDYNIISTPQVLVLDKDKRIRFKNAPAESLGDICDVLLDEYNDIHPMDNN